MKPNRPDVIAALVLATLATLCWVPRLQGPIDLRWDGAAYYILGTALAEGKGYRLLNEPGDIQSTLHPPMLPALIALHRWIVQTDNPVVLGHWLRLTYVVFFVAYVVAGYFMLRLFLPTSYSFLGALVFALQLHTVFMSDLCFPEIPFGLATVLFTLCNSSTGPSRFLRAPLAVISYALRTVGVALLAAWVGEAICNRRLKQAALRALISVVPVLCWIAYVAHVEASREYQHPVYEYQRADYTYPNVSYARNLRYKDSFRPELGYASLRDKAKGFVHNMFRMAVTLGEAVSTKEGVWDVLRSAIDQRVGHAVLPLAIIRLTLLLLSALIVYGIGLQLANRQYFIPLYVALSLIAICATPWPGQFNRYLVPLAPFLSLSLFLALRSIAGIVSDRLSLRSRLVAATATGALLSMIFASQVPALLVLFTKWHQKVEWQTTNGARLEYRLFFYQGFYPAADAAVDWLRGRARASDVIAAADPQWVYLRTGLKSVLPPFEPDPAKAQSLLDSVPVTFLMVDEGDLKAYTAPVVAAHPDRWRRAFAQSTKETSGQTGSFAIYERVGRR